jgi:hypothetical protein
MQPVTTIGFDIAKSVFQVHGIGGEGANTLKQSRRPSGGLNRSHCIARLRRGRKGKSRVMMA